MDFLGASRDSRKTVSLETLIAKEKTLWETALAKDPLLPRRLLPDALGKTKILHFESAIIALSDRS
jgi:hypothetical protein